MVKTISIRDERVIGVLDFSRGKDPFDTYRRTPSKSLHLEFVRLGDNQDAIAQFINKWGILSRSAITGPQSQLLIPAIISSTHPVQRKMPIPELPFALSLRIIRKYRNQVRALWDLWIALKAQDPDKMVEALQFWSEVSKYSLEDLELKPYPLVGGPIIAKKAVRLTLAELKVCTVAAISRSFRDDFRNLLGTGGPFLCSEPIYYNTVIEIETMRMHYHIADLREAIYCMILADITANKEFRSCKKCGRLFALDPPTRLFCSKACAQASASHTYYQKHRQKKKPQ